jgi:hypothetical protein
MERAVAIKKLTKILGKSLGYRVDPKAADQDDRNEAMAKLPDVRSAVRALEIQMRQREDAILEADAEYQRLKAARADAKKALDNLLGTTSSYRFTVGVMSSMFFHVKAQGDSWEEVIAQLTEKKADA